MASLLQQQSAAAVALINAPLPPPTPSSLPPPLPLTLILLWFCAVTVKYGPRPVPTDSDVSNGASRRSLRSPPRFVFEAVAANTTTQQHNFSSNIFLCFVKGPKHPVLVGCQSLTQSLTHPTRGKKSEIEKVSWLSPLAQFIDI